MMGLMMNNLDQVISANTKWKEKEKKRKKRNWTSFSLEIEQYCKINTQQRAKELLTNHL
jgi:hypothetical protein